MSPDIELSAISPVTPSIRTSPEALWTSTRPVIARGTSMVMSDQAWRPAATRALPGLAEAQGPPRRNARVIWPTTASRSTSPAIPAHPVPGCGFARTSIRFSWASIVSSHLVIAELARKTGGDMADEHVGALDGTDGDVATGIVDARARAAG